MIKDGKVVVVPLKPAPQTKNVSYLMVEKPMHGTGLAQLEFPSGEPAAGEALETAAKRIFLQETGYDPTWAKFLYAFFPNPQGSNYRVSVFMGLALGESESDHATVELSGDDLLKKIRENELVDGATLAAFSAVLLQSNEAKKYLIQELEADSQAPSKEQEGTEDEEI